MRATVCQKPPPPARMNSVTCDCCLCVGCPPVHHWFTKCDKTSSLSIPPLLKGLMESSPQTQASSSVVRYSLYGYACSLWGMASRYVWFSLISASLTTLPVENSLKPGAVSYSLYLPVWPASARSSVETGWMLNERHSIVPSAVHNLDVTFSEVGSFEWQMYIFASIGTWSKHLWKTGLWTTFLNGCYL